MTDEEKLRKLLHEAVTDINPKVDIERLRQKIREVEKDGSDPEPDSEPEQLA